MTKKTYRLHTIADLLQVPAERRAECVKDLLTGLELCEFAGAKSLVAMTWTDDSDRSCTIDDTAGKRVVSLGAQK